MKKIFTEYYSPQKSIYFSHVIDFKSDERLPFIAESHPFYELLYIVSGDTQQIINENLYQSTTGDLIIIDKQQPHNMQPHLNEGDYERYILRFSPNLLSFHDLKTEDVFKNFLNLSYNTFTILKKQDTDKINLLDFFQKIENLTLQQNNELMFIQIITIILELLTTIYEQTQHSTSSTTPLEVNEHIRAIIHYINENIYSKITLKKISEALYLNQYYITHLFTKHLGISIKKYITDTKIHYAENLINAGEAPTSVAIKLGFDYYSTFFNAYQKTLGKKPSVTKDKKNNN